MRNLHFNLPICGHMKSKLQIFGNKVFSLLVENFKQTFFVGGTVRDMLLKKEVKDIDIATSAKPEQVAEILKSHFIEFDLGFRNLGVVVAREGGLSASIATFRKETYGYSRYPKINLTTSLKEDSKRRDFTINSLYLSPYPYKIHDFYQGKKDLRKKYIRFVGDPDKKIQEDPLRIIRALRFKVVLNFKIEKKSALSIRKNFHLVKTLTASRIRTEIEKIKSLSKRKLLLGILEDKKLLDNYLKKS